ncbi:transmembrane protein 120B isoform X1 [Peromyscus californicus insignis]|uniref:transmembrane protein 120B isoform X1 n=1 Tax=Peromyscus californicus insignis TaxID=564181 RepID=UPI0022A6E2DA|nr:transmembrane protein 120B isoform X1 [Peromyscus californicus insignis]
MTQNISQYGNDMLEVFGCVAMVIGPPSGERASESLLQDAFLGTRLYDSNLLEVYYQHAAQPYGGIRCRGGPGAVAVCWIDTTFWCLRTSQRLSVGARRFISLEVPLRDVDEEETHRIYKQKLEELTALQTLCSTSISKQKRHLRDLKRTLQRYKRHSSQEEAELVQQIGANIKERQNVFFDMEAYLPKKNGLYLNLVLGNVNVTLLSNQAKFAYKDEYEKFKLYLTIILLLGAVACRFVLHYRVTDEVFNFLLVWYYCTLTIRESILISNGSRIKGWWVSHHYVSTFLSGVMLTWPNGLIYQKFRNQFLAFSIFQSCVQFLQYYYQRGCLYRLRALGERNHLDLTVEGFQSWMWRGLTFLLPFLFCGHFWQLYNAVTLFELSSQEECKEWQVFVLALTFLILFLGNFLTTLKVVHTKLQKNRNKTKQP